MAHAPKTVSWPLEQHTAVKHDMLRWYLDAWLPVMSSKFGRLVLIDGFAGPGHYDKGEPGSPLVMLRALLGRHDFASLSGTQFDFVFIEKSPKRFAELNAAVGALGTLPPNVTVHLINAGFCEVMADRERFLPPQVVAAAALVFIDPFGYKDTRIADAEGLLSFPRSEVFIYVPLYHVARFIDNADQATRYTQLFGDDRWRQAAQIDDLDARKVKLRDLFLEALRQHADFCGWFEMRGLTPNSGYYLFFGSNSPRGLQKMKDAMWRADPVEGRVFADAASPGQLTALGEAHLAPLVASLYRRFGEAQFTIADGLHHVLIETQYKESHVRKPLAALERVGVLEANRHGGRDVPGQYPAGTTLRFRENPMPAFARLRRESGEVPGVSAAVPAPDPVQMPLWP